MKLVLINKRIAIITLIFTLILVISSIIYSLCINSQYHNNKQINGLTQNDTNKYCIDDKVDKTTEDLIEKYKQKKLIALTFDDGPSKHTELLIQELNKRGVKATFFVLGQNISKYPSVLSKSISYSNEIGIHGYTHKLFTKLNDDKITEEIYKTKEALSAVSKQEIIYIRVPYGSINERVVSVLDKHQLINVLWTVDSKDWKFKNTNKTYKQVMSHIKGNEIILMHDTFKTSVEAAIQIVDELKSRCYTFVTITEYIRIQHLVTDGK